MSLPSGSKLNDYSYKEIESILNDLFEPRKSLTSFLITFLYPLPNSTTKTSTNTSNSLSSSLAPFKSNKIYHDYKSLIETCRLHLAQLINDLNKSKYLNGNGLSYNSLSNLLNKIIFTHPRVGPPKPLRVLTSEIRFADYIIKDRNKIYPLPLH